MPINIVEGDLTFSLNENTLRITWLDLAVATMSRDEWLRIVRFFAAADLVISPDSPLRNVVLSVQDKSKNQETRL